MRALLVDLGGGYHRSGKCTHAQLEHLGTIEDAILQPGEDGTVDEAEPALQRDRQRRSALYLRWQLLFDLGAAEGSLALEDGAYLRVRADAPEQRAIARSAFLHVAEVAVYGSCEQLYRGRSCSSAVAASVWSRSSAARRSRPVA